MKYLWKEGKKDDEESAVEIHNRRVANMKPGDCSVCYGTGCASGSNCCTACENSGKARIN